jgi:hypothetical protein
MKNVGAVRDRGSGDLCRRSVSFGKVGHQRGRTAWADSRLWRRCRPAGQNACGDWLFLWVFSEAAQPLPTGALQPHSLLPYDGIANESLERWASSQAGHHRFSSAERTDHCSSWLRPICSGTLPTAPPQVLCSFLDFFLQLQLPSFFTPKIRTSPAPRPGLSLL